MPDREWGKVFEKINLLIFKVIFGPFVVQQVPRARLCCMYQIWTFYCFCHWFVQLLSLQIYKEKPTLNPRDEAEFANFTMQNFKIISPILPALWTLFTPAVGSAGFLLLGKKKKKNYIETQLFYFLVHRYKVFNFIFKFLHLILPVSSILCFWYWCKSSHPNTDWSHDDQRKGIILIYQFYRLITYASRTSCSVWRTWKLSENVAVTLQCLVGQNLSSDLSRAAFVSWALCWVCLILGAVPAPLSGDPPLWHHSATPNHSGFWNCKLKTGEKSIYEIFFFPNNIKVLFV